LENIFFISTAKKASKNISILRQVLKNAIKKEEIKLILAAARIPSSKI
jgi:hypothetical protein